MALLDTFGNLSIGKQMLIGAIAVTIFYGLLAGAVSAAHASWCRSQWTVATTHADTVSTVRWCGTPKSPKSMTEKH